MRRTIGTRRELQIIGIALLVAASSGAGVADVIPWAQDKLPGPPLSPKEAMAKMTVPDGFIVELVAAEPDIVNPVAMCFDERGRIWITESIEYPRHAPGPGRDRIKVLEDTNGDGRADKVTVFAEGLNIPSGIAVGHGGVWVANAPDILFMQDTDGDGRADKVEVVVTGFGRRDTHELPNSLTWGPDGYLYGCNGIFNPGRVEQDGVVHEFDGAIFRIHPRTRKFEIFARGLSNPWGITFDENGEMFVSACVIDHLWHIVPGGYYIRQAGPYPSHTWPIESIVDHKHQKAAYCGIVWFDSDAWPAEYRRKLYMGNIHGNCINADVLQRRGSTYSAQPLPDLLSAHDTWFMPVAQKVGPDGNLYILDWYDRYHCYQDAMRDAAGIDRLKGRLYRLRYRGAIAGSLRDPSPITPEQRPGSPSDPASRAIDLSREPDARLIERLSSPNIFIRETAQRLLNERDSPDTRPKLQTLAINTDAPRHARLHALWALISTGRLESDFHMAVLQDTDATFRAWGVRAAANFPDVGSAVADRIAAMTADESPIVRLHLAAASRREEEAVRFDRLIAVLDQSGDDPLVPVVVWHALHPVLAERMDGPDGGGIVKLANLASRGAGAKEVVSRAAELCVSSDEFGPEQFRMLFVQLIDQAHFELADRIFRHLFDRIVSGQLKWEMRNDLADRLAAAASDSPFGVQFKGSVRLMAASGRPELAKTLLRGDEFPERDRLAAIKMLISANDSEVVDLALQQAISEAGLDYRRALIATLGTVQDTQLPYKLVEAYSTVEPALRPRIIDVLVQRPMSAGPLLRAIEEGQVSRDALNTNQVRNLAASPDQEIRNRVEKIWGKVRTERNPEREKAIEQTRRVLAKTPADSLRGREVFNRVCAQCHVFRGEGTALGPDLTGSGTGSFEQLLSNVLDPNLVIGEVYQVRTVLTTDGQTLMGLLAEEDGQRVVLKLPGGQTQAIPRGQIASLATLPVSLMPEGLEQSMTEQELADLLGYLMADEVQ